MTAKRIIPTLCNIPALTILENVFGSRSTTREAELQMQLG